MNKEKFEDWKESLLTEVKELDAIYEDIKDLHLKTKSTAEKICMLLKEGRNLDYDEDQVKAVEIVAIIKLDRLSKIAQEFRKNQQKRNDQINIKKKLQ